MATGRYKALDFLQITSHVTEISFEKMAVEEKNREIIENDVAFMTSDYPLECFENECDEDDIGCTKCCSYGSENFFCAIPSGHLMCTFCMQEDECLKSHRKIDSKFALFFSESSFFCSALKMWFRVSYVLVESLDIFWSILTFLIVFS